MGTKSDLSNCVGPLMTGTGSWDEADIIRLWPLLLEQGWLLRPAGAPSWGQGVSVGGRQTPPHLHLPGQESQQHLALRRQQNWEPQFSNFGV